MKDEVVGPRAYAIKSWRPIHIKRMNNNNPTVFIDERIRNRTKDAALWGLIFRVLWGDADSLWLTITSSSLFSSWSRTDLSRDSCNIEFAVIPLFRYNKSRRSRQTAFRKMLQQLVGKVAAAKLHVVAGAKPVSAKVKILCCHCESCLTSRRMSWFYQEYKLFEHWKLLQQADGLTLARWSLMEAITQVWTSEYVSFRSSFQRSPFLGRCWF